MKDNFGGKLIQQVISKECEHISEREEDFFALQVWAVLLCMYICINETLGHVIKTFQYSIIYTQCEVKNKKNIEESLQLYIQEELLEGDNKYLCAQCDKKVNAAKRYERRPVDVLKCLCLNFSVSSFSSPSNVFFFLSSLPPYNQGLC